MKTRIVVLLVLALLGCQAGILSGQKKKKKSGLEKVRAMITAPTAEERTRGAMLAAKKKLKGVVPDLIRVIMDYPEKGIRSADAFAVDAAFDALIQMGANVRSPADGQVMTRLPRMFLHPAIILLSRSSGQHQHTLMNLVKPENIGRFPTDVPAVSASCAITAALRTSGLATYACRILDSNVHVWITDTAGRRTLKEPDARSTRKSPPRTVPKGFPPIGFYRLVAVRGQKGKLLVRGNPNIAYQRVVAGTGKTIKFPEVKTPQPTMDHVGITTLAKLLGTRNRKLLNMLPRKVTVRYRNEPHLDRVVTKAKEDLEKGFTKLFDMLMEKKLLRADEAMALMPKVKVVEHDTRKDKK